MQKTKWYQKRILSVPAGGIIIGFLLLALMQLVYYNIGGIYARQPGQTIHILKIAALDDAIPMVQIFIIPYLYSYVFWLVGLIAPSKTEKNFYYDWVIGSVIALTMGVIIFLVYPTYMYRDQEGLYELAGTGFLGKLITSLYDGDGKELAACLFPSYHCLTSSLCLLGVWGRKEISKGFRIYTLILAVMIYCSTLFVKQHYIPDVICGISLALIGIGISRKFHFGRKLADRFPLIF